MKSSAKEISDKNPESDWYCFLSPPEPPLLQSLQNAQHPGIPTHTAASLTQAAVFQKIQLSASK